VAYYPSSILSLFGSILSGGILSRGILSGIPLRQAVEKQDEKLTRNQYASLPRQCSTGRTLERLWRNFVSLVNS